MAGKMSEQDSEEWCDELGLWLQENGIVPQSPETTASQWVILRLLSTPQSGEDLSAKFNAMMQFFHSMRTASILASLWVDGFSEVGGIDEDGMPMWIRSKKGDDAAKEIDR